MSGRPANLVGRARRKLGRLRRTRMMVRAVNRRVDAQRDQVRTLEKRVERAESSTRSARELEKRIAELERTDAIRGTFAERLATQLAAVEERLGGLDERLADGTFVADDAGQAQARDLVAEVRREHAQVRARLQVVSAYEERIRRLEAVVAELSGGDLRRPV